MSESQSIEVWKEAQGFPGYEVSTEGRIRSYWKHRGSHHTKEYYIGSEPTMLKPWPDHKGYWHIDLRSPTGKKRGVNLMRLILTTFVRPPLPKEMALHKDDPTPSNIRVDNLQWGYIAQNNGEDVVRHHGKHPYSSFTPEDVKKIRERLANGERHRIIAADYGVDRTTITAINRKKNHKYIE